jgi:beta-phosphoglucomutase
LAGVILGIVFDFDGVLADSEPLHLAAYQEVFAARGIVLTREEYYARYLGYNDDGVFRRMGAAHGLDLGEDEIVRLIDEKSAVFDRVIARTDVLYPGASACIERLAAEFPLGIASGAMRHEIEMVLKRARLDRHFRFIVASGETLESKPAPDPYVRAAQLHGLPPASCVAIEDSRWGIESAQAAGMKCVAITNTYGSGELAAADAIVTALEQFTPGFIREL